MEKSCRETHGNWKCQTEVWGWSWARHMNLGTDSNGAGGDHRGADGDGREE